MPAQPRDRPPALEHELERVDRELRAAVAERDRLEGWERGEKEIEIDQLLERRHELTPKPAA